MITFRGSTPSYKRRAQTHGAVAAENAAQQLPAYAVLAIKCKMALLCARNRGLHYNHFVHEPDAIWGMSATFLIGRLTKYPKKLTFYPYSAFFTGEQKFFTACQQNQRLQCFRIQSVGGIRTEVSHH